MKTYPAQAPPQHFPSKQSPDLHSWSLPQAAPGSFFGTHDSSPVQ
jgi:hypothetical protein